MAARIVSVRAAGMEFQLSVEADTPDIFHEGAAAGQIYDWTWQFLMRWLGPSDVLFDVGANIGTVTIPGAMRCRVVCSFELLEDNVRHLRSAVRANDLANVLVVHAAVSDVPGMTGATGTSAWAMVDPSGLPTTHQIKLDDFISANPNFPPTVIKIDVEGSEKRALAGMRCLIAEQHPDIIIEANAFTCGHAGYSCRDLLVSLRAAGYSIYRLFSGRLIPQDGGLPVQELVLMDYLATTKPAEQIRSRGFDLAALSEKEMIENVRSQDGLPAPHPAYVLAVWDHLPEALRRDGDLAALVEQWRGNVSDDLMHVLRVGAGLGDLAN